MHATKKSEAQLGFNIQMNTLYSCYTLAIFCLIQKSSAYAYSAQYTYRIPTAFGSRTLSPTSLNMVRTGGLEIREEGATPTGKCKE
jgi:hypothetical protein